MGVRNHERQELMLEWKAGERRAACPREGCRSASGRADPSVGMSVLDDGAVYARCFRNCGLNGVISDYTPTDGKAPKPIQLTFDEPLVSDIPAAIKSAYLWEYNINDDDIEAQGIKWAPETRRIHFPVFNHKGETVGGHLHATDNTQRKRHTYRLVPDVPLVHFPKGRWLGGQHSGLVVTEDIVSAIRVNQFAPAAAMLGAHITQSHVSALLEAGWQYLAVAFDGDTAGTVGAVKFIRAYGAAFRSVARIALDKGVDPKNLTDEQLMAIAGKARV